MKKQAKVLIAIGLGGLMGALMTGLVLFAAMPTMMLKTYETQYGYDETIARLQERIEADGWVVSGVSDMNKSLAKQGVDFKPRVTLVSLCHPDYAQSVLTSDRYVSVMMPCKFSVWEGDDGKVYLTKMNMGLMGKLFGGNIAHVMSGKVAVDEEKILDGLLKQ
jgi:uncharacterized protein (DUF302 family)